MNKPNSVIKVQTSVNTDFFRLWLEFLRPFHRLTNKELEVATCFIKHYYELSKVISDPKILNQVSMSDEVKRKIREECNIKLPNFQVIMGKLKKNKVIVDGKINPKFIPDITEENGYFQLLLLFELK